MFRAAGQAHTEGALTSAMSESEATAKAQAYDRRPFIQNLAQGAGLAISAKLGLQRDWDVLDFGCGTGLVLERIADQVRHVVGVDSSLGMIGVCNEKLDRMSRGNVTTCCLQLSSSESLHEHFLKHDIADAIPRQFDLIYSSMTLHHIEHISDTVKVLQSCLKPKGLLVAFDLEKGAESMLFHPQPISPSVHHPGGFTSDQLCEWWKDEGMDNVTCEQVHRFKKDVEVDGQPKSVTFWMLMVRGAAK